jgi:hypothetical protein
VEIAIAELRRLGIPDEDIGVAVADPGHYQHRDPSDREVFGAAGGGIAKGAPLGSVAGITLAGVRG